MLPRVEIKARELLLGGASITKYDLAKAAPCDQRTAQRALAKLHKAGMGIRIIWWQKVYHQTIPIYHISHGIDVPKPEAMTNAARQRRMRVRKK